MNVTDGRLKEKAQLYREVEVTLPRELNRSERVALVENFVRSAFVSQGMVADIAIHNRRASDGQEQPHAHIMLTMRRLEMRPDKQQQGQYFGNKAREWNTPDALYGELAALKAKIGHLRNDIQRFGPTAPLSAAAAGTETYLDALRQEDDPDPKAVARIERKLTALRQDMKLFGEEGRLDVALRAAEMQLKPLQEQMPLCQWRAAWAKAANDALEKAGESARIDHRTLAAQRAEALAEGDLERAEALNREPQKPIGMLGRINDAYWHVAQHVHSWAAIEMRQKMERAFAHLHERDPARLKEAMLRIQDWTEEVIERFNRTQSPEDLVPEVRHGPRP